MLLILSKFLALFFYPVGMCLIFAIAGLIFALRRNRRLYLSFFCASILVLGLCSWPPFSHSLLRSLEGRYNQGIHYPPCSAIILLSGSEVAALPPRQYPEINDAGDRIFHAARMLKLGYAPVIIATGGKIDFIREFDGSEAQIAFSLLTELFAIDSSKIIVEPRARNTFENIKKILHEKGLSDSVLVVTSASHMPRAMGLAKKAGLVPLAAPADFRTDTQFQWKLYNLVPQVGALQNTTTALHEYYGLVAYRLLGWI
jgi:uncharacterized SAM-binding protein YcdF (DUF218 family)